VRIRNPKHRAKAEAFWSRLAEKRKQPGNCCRCGKPHAGEFRQCDPCRLRVAQLKAKRAAKGIDLAGCVAMCLQMRREVTRLRESFKNARRRRHNAYNLGWRRGRKEWREANHYADSLPTISLQEAACISHSFDRG